MRKVRIWLKTTSDPIELDVKNMYEKGSYTCFYRQDGTVDKYPTSDIFRIQQPYMASGASHVHSESINPPTQSESGSIKEPDFPEVVK